MRSQPTTSDLLKNESLSVALTEMDAETCDDCRQECLRQHKEVQ
jgi:hypothetical protein